MGGVRVAYFLVHVLLISLDASMPMQLVTCVCVRVLWPFSHSLWLAACAYVMFDYLTSCMDGLMSCLEFTIIPST